MSSKIVVVKINIVCTCYSGHNGVKSAINSLRSDVSNRYKLFFVMSTLCIISKLKICLHVNISQGLFPCMLVDFISFILWPFL